VEPIKTRIVASLVDGILKAPRNGSVQVFSRLLLAQHGRGTGLNDGSMSL
jgi:hypothetical protein